jgi:hypothetical protein
LKLSRLLQQAFDFLDGAPFDFHVSYFKPNLAPISRLKPRPAQTGDGRYDGLNHDHESGSGYQPPSTASKAIARCENLSPVAWSEAANARSSS